MSTLDALLVTVNGDDRPLPAGCTVFDMLGLLRLDPRKVAVELNEAIVPKSRYDAVTLAAKDRIEIVHFIGGG